MEFFKHKSILITGSTGFLAKILVEKLLRVQPDVKRLFLLVRAADAESAMQCLQNEIVGTDLFNVLRDKHGSGFQSLVANKLFPVAGDIARDENLGIGDSNLLQNLYNEIQIVVNVAATTNFYERYDDALGINVLGAKHVLDFAKKCFRLEMLLHVSTAYVAGVQSGLILEKKFDMGETLVINGNSSNNYLDIEEELKLADEKKRELQANDKVTQEAQKLVMKELGRKRARLYGWPNTYVFTKAMGEMLLGHLRGDLPLVILRPTIITSIYRDPLPGWIEGTRTVDALIMGYAKGKLSCFFGDHDMIADVIPGDMVVNAMIATMAAHQQQPELLIYHISSSVRNPVKYLTIEESGFRYFLENPRVGNDGKSIKTKMFPVYPNMTKFRIHMTLKYKLPLEVMHLVNLLSCGVYGRRYDELNKKYKFGMLLVDLYEPYAFFKGRLRRRLEEEEEEEMFDFDPKHIDWSDYFYSIHIPGVIKVQPDVERLFLLVRAADAASAMERMQTQILGKELFKVLKEIHGDDFHSFAANKLFPVAGDIVLENLGIQDSNLLQNLRKQVDLIVNVAATTNFYERYDVALGINVLGTKHVLQFAKRCAKLEMFLHVSTAYVAGEQSGLILEKRFGMGETLKGGGYYLDVEAEIRLANKKKKELQTDQNVTKLAEKLAMKQFGRNRAKLFGWPNTYVFTKAMGEMLLGHLRGDLPVVILRPTIITSIYKDPLPGWIEGTRTIDSLIVSYAKRDISHFVGDPEMIVDVIPGDMVVNAMMATIAAHWSQRADELFIYHVGSSVRNPLTYDDLLKCVVHFVDGPKLSTETRSSRNNSVPIFTNMVAVILYATLLYKIPLKVMYVLSLVFGGVIARRYNELSRKLQYAMFLLDLYKPYAFFKGCFDDLNLQRLRMAMQKGEIDDESKNMFELDPKKIGEWKEYLHNIHIPGLLKYVAK
ncbi:hypothetical protein Cni_G05269 [Canna indica]|uniref:Fatty acyl-CoA reductase n=1 Tax=Canna indica TaxID=4628 RepID=A0AAQ3Q594_9LILI|nr:hypothetical protein Cni_G05269 [Canna indica]